jgi:phosphotransacetylase
MKTYNGGSISNWLKKRNEKTIWVTDTFERAARYANAQATGVVCENETSTLAEGAVVFEVETSVRFTRRNENHGTLDVCEAETNSFEIIRATVRFNAYWNTLYGTRQTGYLTQQQVIDLLRADGIEVVS